MFHVATLLGSGNFAFLFGGLKASESVPDSWKLGFGWDRHISNDKDSRCHSVSVYSVLCVHVR